MGSGLSYFPGDKMNKRKTARQSLLVDIEIANSGHNRCRGYVNNISRDGLSITLRDGHFPIEQKSVLLNFNIWTGSETLFRKMLAKIVRIDGQEAGLVFAGDDRVTAAIVQDLLHYKMYERRKQSRLAASKYRMADAKLEFSNV